MARLQRTLGAVYEEFQPELRLTETPEDHILHIHLPGFTREQVNIRYVSSNKTLNISGEKPEGGNRWSHFSEAIPVPANCEVNRLGAKFDKGILTITMPKKFITPVVPKEELRTSEEEISQVPSLASAIENFQPKVEKTENMDAHILQVYLAGFSKDQVKIKYISSSRVMSIFVERPIEGGNKMIRVDQAYPVPENCDAERVHGKFDQGILTITMPKKFIPQMDKEGLVPEPSRLTLLHEHVAPSAASAEVKRTEDIVSALGKGIQEVAASSSNAVTNIGDGTLNDEEKHLLGVLIAALGAYVSYRLTNSGKPYNY